VLVTPLINRRGALPVTAVTLSFGALPMVLFGASKIPGLVAGMSLAQWLVTIGLIGGNAVAAMLFWNAGSAVLGAQRAGWFLYLLPLVSLLGGAALLSEPMSWLELLGGALILLSVFLAHLEAKPPL
jgi:drug/metabolite transporter (DMT)-like permease